jgi:hypothetical protein
MKELTNKQKLEVLEETQRNYRGSFLCHKIAQSERAILSSIMRRQGIRKQVFDYKK